MITFICCVWNEIARAPEELNKLISKLDQNSFDYEIIIIDNFSTDGTREWLSKINNDKVRVILNDTNLGKGGSIKLGILNSNGKFGIIYDLDAEYTVEDALIGIGFISKTDATVSLASRTLDGSKKYVYALNFMGVKFITSLINFLYKKNLTDTATGLKILKIDFFKKNKLFFNGFNVDFEIVCLALSKNKLVNEYPGSYFPRSKAQGKKIKAIKDGTHSLLAIIYTYLFK